MKFIWALVFTLFFIPGIALGKAKVLDRIIDRDMEISGDYEVDQTLVRAGATLTIKEGSNIEFARGASSRIIVQGMLKMKGTASKPVNTIGPGLIVFRNISMEESKIHNWHAEASTILIKRSTSPLTVIDSRINRIGQSRWGTPANPEYWVRNLSISGSEIKSIQFGSNFANCEFKNNLIERLQFQFSTMGNNHILNNNIDFLIISSWGINSSIQYNNIGTMEWRNSRWHNSYDGSIQFNNFNGSQMQHPGRLLILSRGSGENYTLNLRANYWGPNATKELKKIATGNQEFIHDIYDDLNLDEVDYSHYLNFPVPKAGPQQ